MNKKIAIIGTGGVGGYFGGKIAKFIEENPDSKGEVYFLARGEHLQKIKENGLILDAHKIGKLVCKPTIASDDIKDLPKADIVLLCVKSYDLESVSKQLDNYIGDNTIVIPLLNGIDIVERVRTQTSKGIVLPSCVYVGTNITAPGVVTQRGGNGIILCGKSAESHFDPKQLAPIFDEMDIKFEAHDDPYPAIWKKYVFIAAFGLITAYSHKTLAEVIQDTDLKSEVTQIMEEIIAIANAKGVILPNDTLENALETATGFDAKTSYQRDVEGKGNLNEGEIFGKTVIRLGKEFGVATPVTERIFATIEAEVN